MTAPMVDDASGIRGTRLDSGVRGVTEHRPGLRSAAVEEAQRRIELILDPPTAELGAEYTGKVVNVTKFGAFVNILPGRDGLL
ncbi:MAG: S1 RNA-binding domain-containing protein, partial [Acidimicrobiia bacterium]